MRVLLSSVGRRGYLVKYFKQAVGNDGQVWGADSSRYTPAFQYCDKAVLLPEVSSSDYLDDLICLCKDNKIDIVVPLIDPELEVLAANRAKFDSEGILVVVSPLKTVEITFDKLLTYKFARQRGIPVPETVASVEEAMSLLSSGKLGWPVVVKPRKGSASANITYCSNESQLRFACESCPGPMIQEFLPGDEYGYDLFCDRNYRPISVFCRRKLAMRAGETDKAVSTDDKQLIALGVEIAESFRIFGPADVDVRVGKSGPMLLEINPRFGGGYPCSHLCGADFPAKLIAIWRNQILTLDIGSYPAGVYMLKQDEIISPTGDHLKSILNRRADKAK